MFPIVCAEEGRNASRRRALSQRPSTQKLAETMKNYARIAAAVAVLALVAGFIVFRGGAPETTTPDPLPAVTVYKSPTCGCCTKWVEHLQASGFEVKMVDMPNVAPMKEQLGLPRDLGSCHTAVVDGYVVEGHVPADVVKKMLAERPKAVGIAVPGMPIGSPGMEQGDRKDPYDIVLFTRDGTRSVYASR